MKSPAINLQVGDAPEIEAFLAERIHEFNASDTGYFDGESFSATLVDDHGSIRAGTYGYTWGGCAYVSYLWVRESERGRGHGTAFMNAIERHAYSKGCKVVFLATHTFQAPAFYAGLGYQRQAVLRERPIGHASYMFAKWLA